MANGSSVTRSAIDSMVPTLVFVWCSCLKSFWDNFYEICRVLFVDTCTAKLFSKDEVEVQPA